jgi:hypothetical protein
VPPYSSRGWVAGKSPAGASDMNAEVVGDVAMTVATSESPADLR